MPWFWQFYRRTTNCFSKKSYSNDQVMLWKADVIRHESNVISKFRTFFRLGYIHIYIHTIYIYRNVSPKLVTLLDFLIRLKWMYGETPKDTWLQDYMVVVRRYLMVSSINLVTRWEFNMVINDVRENYIPDKQRERKDVQPHNYYTNEGMRNLYRKENIRKGWKGTMGIGQRKYKNIKRMTYQ